MNNTQTVAKSGIHPATSVDELLTCDGENFVRLAYYSVLRREPDEGGLANYVAQIKSGVSKSSVVFELYHSEEGKQVRESAPNLNIAGLDALLRRERTSRSGLIPSLISRLSNGKGGQTDIERQLKTELGEFSKRLVAVESQLDPHRSAECDGLCPHAKGAITNLFRTFDPDAYLDANQDVKMAAVNPFEHFMRFGWRENRATRFDLSKPVAGNYQDWIRRYDTLDDVGRSALRARSRILKYRPLISVILPTYNPKIEWLNEAIGSVQKQLYENWELCIADDCSTNPEVRNVLAANAKQDTRIKVVWRSVNGHISAASNSALNCASGEWIALLDHDDVLAESALYFVAEAINRYPDICLIYSDEDKLFASGRREQPYFKCDWNPDLFYSHNLISHLGVYKKSIVDQIGGFRVGYEGSQDHDLALRFIENIAPKQIHHIPRVLYHWRSHPESTSQGSHAKPYAATSGERAINEHFERLGTAARVEWSGHGYRARYALPAEPPLVSLIIPTRNAHALVRQCIESIWNKTLYKNYEIVLIDNGSDSPQSMRYFDELKTRGVSVIRDDRPFNFSALNNLGVARARGTIIGLINNDVEVIAPEWLGEMVSHALRPEVGAVGGKLLYSNNTIQHSGVVLGVGGIAGHAHKHFDRNSHGYFGRLSLISSYSAVTAACLLVRKDLFLEVGGLDEDNLGIAFNDVDFCLKLREAGYRNMFTPHALLYHHESASRGYDDLPVRTQRFSNEIKYMKMKWGRQLLHDPAYSPNLTLAIEDFTLALTPRVEPFGDE